MKKSRLTLYKRLNTFAAVLIFHTACAGDDVGASKLGSVKAESDLASAMVILGRGPLSAETAGDSLRVLNGYRVQRYMTQGKLHQVLWYREVAGSLEDPITRANDTPVLVVADTVRGWGWDFFEEYASENGLPNPLKESMRLDSISRAQGNR